MTAVALTGRGVESSPTHLKVVDDIPFDQYAKLLERAGAIGDAAKWWIGDLLLFGERRYGHEYAQVLGDARISERQSSRYRYVAERVRPSRRRENLSFSHHEEVAPLEPPQQRTLLARAEKEGWSHRELREAIQNLHVLKDPPPRLKKAVILGAPEVDAVAGLATVRETLVTIGRGLEQETAETVGIPQAIRAIDATQKTVRLAAERLDRPNVIEAAQRVISETTRSNGFAMQPIPVFDTFAAAVQAAEGRKK